MSNRRVTTYRALASASRVALLDALQHRDGLTVTELAQVVGIHANTAREHLARLIDAGFVTCAPEERRTRGRPRMLYHAVATPEPVTTPGRAADERDEHAREELLRLLLQGFGSGTPHDVERARDLGREASRHPGTLLGSPAQGPRVDDGCTDLDPVSGAGCAQLALLEDHLAATGFDPETSEGGTVLETHGCPFFDLAREHPEVVCRLHEGLLEGVLARGRGPWVLDGIETFVAPGRCIVRVRRTDDATHAPSRALPTFPQRAAATRTELPTAPRG
ncbi:metalloregulator ArsR/SmtB family transcription factor [Sanguibacter sp. HDW7]|uniref:helix-turn-helix transcriptional regulator n=1 Tax=Sanguibacter sp. HDW7 TaxID=2714931 RepID=UPI00140CCD5E|nr:helix-turn-helix domain-containing protein [Sanguibacter sp. HDW7]QIK83630.1 helix-turn-helix domain-containing protein [Sanguibacter sp. HDW7]